MFKWIKHTDQVRNIIKKQDRISFKQSEIENCAGITFVALAQSGTLDDVTVAEHTALFSPWVEGIAYAIGNIRSYEGDLYRCVQAHTSQSNWTPDKVPALWTKIGDSAEEFPEWSQPVGAHDAYARGDRVSYQNRHWESAVDSNVWAPGVYGWNEAEES